MNGTANATAAAALIISKSDNRQILPSFRLDNRFSVLCAHVLHAIDFAWEKTVRTQRQSSFFFPYRRRRRRPRRQRLFAAVKGSTTRRVRKTSKSREGINYLLGVVAALLVFSFSSLSLARYIIYIYIRARAVVFSLGVATVDSLFSLLNIHYSTHSSVFNGDETRARSAVSAAMSEVAQAMSMSYK